jgi:hypothetical protein
MQDLTPSRCKKPPMVETAVTEREVHTERKGNKIYSPIRAKIKRVDLSDDP